MGKKKKILDKKELNFNANYLIILIEFGVVDARTNTSAIKIHGTT